MYYDHKTKDLYQQHTSLLFITITAHIELTWGLQGAFKSRTQSNKHVFS